MKNNMGIKRLRRVLDKKDPVDREVFRLVRKKTLSFVFTKISGGDN